MEINASVHYCGLSLRYSTLDFQRSGNLQSKLIDSWLHKLEVFNHSLSVKLEDLLSFLSALTSNNAFTIKMWPGGTPHVVVRTLKRIGLLFPFFFVT